MKTKHYSRILDSVLKQTGNTVFEIAPDYTFLETHTASPGDLFIREEEFIGKKLYEILPETLWEKVKPLFQKSYSTQEKISFEYPSITPGDARWFSATLQYYSEDTEYPFYLLCVMDITHQRNAEKEIRFHAEFEEQMVYATSTLLQATEENFDQSLNEVLARIGDFAGVDRAYLFQFRDNHILMDNTHEWCSEGTSPEIDNLKDIPTELFPYWMERLRNNQEVYIPLVAELPDEWAELKAALEPQGIQSLLVLPVLVAGQLFGFIGFDAVKQQRIWTNGQRQLLQTLADNVGSVMLRNQQARHLKEVTLQAQQLAEEATKASRYKSEFLANMSHEMRTPLHGVVGFADLLAQSGLQPQQERYLSLLKDSADTMLKVINQILDFSKIESGKLNLEVVRTCLPDLIERCCNKVRVAAAVKGLEFRYSPDPALPASVMLDDLKLEQVLNNLLGNAVKFTEKGFVELFAENQGPAEEKDKITIRFSIQDSGIGISHEQQVKIFQSFSQADNSISRKYGGTGLGLSISKKLLDLMGADLRLSSVKGKGSKFYFELDVMP